MFNRISVVLLLCLALLSFASCGKDLPADTTTAPTTTAVPETTPEPASIQLSDLGNYTLVRATDASQLDRDFAVDVRFAINIACGTKLSDRDDSTVSEYEILLGATDRPETEAFLAGLRYHDYGYALIGNKLVIAGHTSDTTRQAFILFRDDVLENDPKSRPVFFSETDNKIMTDSSTVWSNITLCGKPISDYAIRYTAENAHYELTLAKRLQKHIAELSGYVLRLVSSDKEKGDGPCIVIGADSAFPVKAGNYALGLGPDGKTIYAGGADSAGHTEAVLMLIDRLTAEEGKDIACVLDTAKPTPINDSTLSTMTFNVWGMKQDLFNMRILQQITDHMPDTFGLQEAMEGGLDYLRNELRGYYADVGTGRSADGSDEYCSIFYAKDKFTLIDSGTKWLSDTPDVCSKFPGTAYTRIFTYALLERKSDGVRFMHINTHLDSRQVGLNQIQVLLNFLAGYPDLPMILTGDFNNHYGGTAHQSIVATRFADPLDLVPGAVKVSTGVNVQVFIDFCFVTDDKITPTLYRVCNNQVLGGYASDHHPVYIEYQLIG